MSLIGWFTTVCTIMPKAAIARSGKRKEESWPRTILLLDCHPPPHSEAASGHHFRKEIYFLKDLKFAEKGLKGRHFRA